MFRAPCSNGLSFRRRGARAHTEQSLCQRRIFRAGFWNRNAAVERSYSGALEGGFVHRRTRTTTYRGWNHDVTSWQRTFGHARGTMFLTAASWDAFEPLKTLLLELAQERSLDALLPLVVSRLVEREDVALSRVWLVSPGDQCASCPNAGVCSNRAQCLHLAASAARPLSGEPVVHSNLSGSFRRIPIGAFKVGLVAQTPPTVVVTEPANDPKIKHRHRVPARRSLGFAGQPLVSRGQLLGLLGVFLRVAITPAALHRLRILATHL